MRLEQEIGLFVRQYGRTSDRHHDPNDRGYDRRVEGMIKRMKAEELDALLRGEVGDESDRAQ